MQQITAIVYKTEDTQILDLYQITFQAFFYYSAYTISWYSAF